jgi:predicted protein tyrosine phosphatase
LQPRKINLTICGVNELTHQQGKHWTHVISIWEKDYLHDSVCRGYLKAIAPGANILFSFFKDVIDYRHPDAPRLEDLEGILAFSGQIPPGANLLVHCRAGISRSTAVAYAILCQHTARGTERENLLHVQVLRKVVVPNRLIVEYADRLLNRDGSMVLWLGP